MLKVKNSARLPLKDFIGKGSYQERIEHAKKLNAQFYTLLQSKAQDGLVLKSDFANLLKKVLPPNIDILLSTYVKKFLGNEGAYVLPLTDEHDEVVERMALRIPTRKLFDNTRVFDKRDANVIMHETFHLFASLANPKLVARITFTQKEVKFYNGYIYTNMHSKFGIRDRFNWKKGIKEFLGRKNLETQINFLQNCRYRLLEEKLAYAEGDKYGNPNSMNKFFYFEEKIKIIEKMLYKTLKKVRKENKKA